MTGPERNIGSLIFPPDYQHELNQVAGVTTENIIFLKRKFLSSQGWELMKYPLRDCVAITYKEELPIARIVVGTLISLLIAAILFYLFEYWDDLDANTKVPVGALGIAGIYGVKLAFGGRRHRLKFKMHDGRTLTWKSLAGERQLMSDSVNGIVEFARSKGLLTP